MAIEDYKIRSINFSNIDEDWVEEFGTTRASVIKLLNMIRELANLNHARPDLRTGAEIGWQSLWCKTFMALMSALQNRDNNMPLVFSGISRMLQEVHLHTTALMDIKKSETEDEFFWARVLVDRLAGYCAWCLSRDISNLEFSIRSNDLNDLFDAEPALSIANDPEKLKLHEKIWGPLDIETDKGVLERQKRSFREAVQKKISWIKDLYEDPTLEDWRSRIQMAKAEFGENFSFMRLMNFKNGESIPKYMQTLGLRFAYRGYSEDSSALHGSSIDFFLTIRDKMLDPRINCEISEIDDWITNLIVPAEQILFFLNFANMAFDRFYNHS
mgnify:CR=1 FL=1